MLGTPRSYVGKDDSIIVTISADGCGLIDALEASARFLKENDPWEPVYLQGNLHEVHGWSIVLIGPPGLNTPGE